MSYHVLLRKEKVGAVLFWKNRISQGQDRKLTHRVLMPHTLLTSSSSYPINLHGHGVQRWAWSLWPTRHLPEITASSSTSGYIIQALMVKAHIFRLLVQNVE